VTRADHGSRNTTDADSVTVTGGLDSAGESGDDFVDDMGSAAPPVIVVVEVSQTPDRNCQSRAEERDYQSCLMRTVFRCGR
jgi:hypothetical protein